MDFQEYKKLVSGIQVGKQLPDAVYIHKSQIDNLPKILSVLAKRVAAKFELNASDWNILKLQKRNFKISYLSYPNFDTYAYPALSKSNTVDLQRLSIKSASYIKSDNPPILHRKETFVSNTYPLFDEFKATTEEGERVGLYLSVKSIGFKRNWERLISNKGYYLDDRGRLESKADSAVDMFEPEKSGEIARHKTAIVRDRLSQPMQVLAKHGFLDGEYSVLDYGCGRGDDIRELEAHGLDCIGWDPTHAPEAERTNCDIVNLGYVLNVIEDREERDSTLKEAWHYTNKTLIASVMVAGESVIRQFRPYKDGVITRTNTFQKYYSQSEFRSYLEITLNYSAIAVGQGIFILFKDEQTEQDFLLARQQIKRDWFQITKRKTISKKQVVTPEIIEKNQHLFDDFWKTILDLGRPAANDEFDYSDQLRRVAKSNKKAFNAVLKHYDANIYEQARKSRQDDLIIYFSLGLFEKRKTYAHMPNSLKRDIKSFFDDYTTAIKVSTIALYSVGDPKIIESKSIVAYQNKKIGEFNTGHSWVIPRSIINELPVELRIYIGCATQLYGDIEEFQLVKIHFTSGKVSLMRYDNWEKSVPLLVERVKIKLAEQDIDFFDYVGEFEPVPLGNKAIFTC